MNVTDSVNAIAIDVNQAILNPIYVKEIKNTNRLLLSYTVNDPKRATELFSWGVDGVFSDCPKGMLEVFT